MTRIEQQHLRHPWQGLRQLALSESGGSRDLAADLARKRAREEDAAGKPIAAQQWRFAAEDLEGTR